MINRFIKFAIRKDITKRNIKINHNSLVRSMDIVDKVPYLAKYHKKKLIAACVALIIMYTYDFHQSNLVVSQLFLEKLVPWDHLSHYCNHILCRKSTYPTQFWSRITEEWICHRPIANSWWNYMLQLTKNSTLESADTTCSKSIRA